MLNPLEQTATFSVQTMITPLIPKSHFIGIDNTVHLAVGGEAPMLNSHMDAMARFMKDKSAGAPSRDMQAEVMESAREKCANLLKVSSEEITLLSSATEGINNVAYGLDWNPGDNVVVADVEFPSDILPWTKLKSQGVEIRIVRHKKWIIEEQDILDQVDENTRVVAISQVSMFTGQQMDVATLSKSIRQSNALFLLDVTHAAGVVPVDANYADIVVSSCYKWLLGTHGTAIFYWNRKRLPDLDPPFLGWRSVKQSGGWKDPLQFSLRDNADRFLPANPSFVSIYILNNALEVLAKLGEERIHQHALALSKLVHAGIEKMGFELMTPAEDHRRAGNTCFTHPDIPSLEKYLGKQNIQIWGTYGRLGRVRVSTHVYNSSEDIDRLFSAMGHYFT